MYVNIGNSSALTTAASVADKFGWFARLFHLTKVQFVVVLIGIVLGIIAVIVFVTTIVRIRRKAKLFSALASATATRRKADPLDKVDFAKYDSEYGFIDFQMRIDSRRAKLVVTSLLVMNLKNTPSNPEPDCYLVLYITTAPSNSEKPLNSNVKPPIVKQQIKRTKTMRDRLTPFYNETLTFSLEKTDILSLNMVSIHFQVFDENPTGNDILIGEGVLDLEKVDLFTVIGKSSEVSVVLGKPLEIMGIGDVCIVIKLSTTSEVTVTLLEAKKMCHKVSKLSGYAVFAKMELFLDGKRRKKGETKRSRDVENPYFNYQLTMALPPTMYSLFFVKVNLYIESVRSGALPSKLGNVLVGAQGIRSDLGLGASIHWEEALNSVGIPIPRWHPIFKRRRVANCSQFNYSIVDKNSVQNNSDFFLCLYVLDTNKNTISELLNIKLRGKLVAVTGN